MRVFNFSRKNLQLQQGFTLVEVMIAVVVFSFGLLGVAGVMLVAVKSNHNGYLRTQATFLAHSMADMMRRNSWSVWSNTYNGNYGGTIVNLTGLCTSASPCAANALANRDTSMWGNMLTQSLPNGLGSIQCVQAGGAPNVVAWNEADRPYKGVCTITVTWNEATKNNAAVPQQIQIFTNT